MRFGASPAGSVREYHCVFIRQSKEERERKDARTYVGRGKSVIFRPTEPTPDQVSDLPVADNTDDLPF